jgi:hypothetical protein
VLGPLTRLANRFAGSLALSAVLVASAASAQTATPTPTTTPTVTPTVTGTPTPSGTETPAPTPTSLFSAARPTLNGGRTTVINASDSFGTTGETVDAGDFEVFNSTNDVETITEVLIEASDQQVVSSFSLTGRDARGNSQVVTTAPSGLNFFFFDPGLVLDPGDSAAFSLSATIAAPNTPNGTATPETFDTSTPTPTFTQGVFGAKGGGRMKVIAATMLPTRRGASFPFGTLALGLVLVGMASAARGDRRGAIAALCLLALVAVVWSGGLSGCSTEETSEQTVTRVTGRNITNPLRFEGVPASLGHVSRPLPLVFPGQNSSIVGTTTPSF